MSGKEISRAKRRAVPRPPLAPADARDTIRPGFPVVGIGASAGGLDALEQLFKAMPRDSGAGFVLIVHLDPSHVSILPDLLQKHTGMPVVHIKHGMRIAPNQVHVITPNKNISILHGTLHVTPMAVPRGVTLPIDTFFRSLAQDQERHAVGIILSGTGSDGTMGIKAIKGGLGMVMVQEPESAKYDGMPKSAIATGLADFVLPPQNMPKQLCQYLAHKEQTAIAWSDGEGENEPLDLQRIFIELRSRTGHDFSGYKQNTILRRVERRMSVHQLDTLEEYVKLLELNESEVEVLFKELLIGVTGFFRDPEAYEALAAAVLPRLAAEHPAHEVIRVWCPGCASGEEPYSVAIMLHECMKKSGRHFRLQVFGTDLDEDAIATARTGVFPASIESDLSPERLRVYFNREEDGRYRVKQMIREMLVFAVQNVIKDPPFTKLDLLCCRNLLIYLGSDLQRKTFSLFHYSLKPGGLLFLGSSEAIGSDADRFTAIDKKWKIFATAGSLLPGRPMMPFVARSEPGRLPAEGGIDLVSDAESLSTLQLVESILQHSDAPPCVVVNDACDVIYVHGRTGRFLEPPEGKVSVNIGEMVRPGLRLALMRAIRQVAVHRQKVVCRGLTAGLNGDKLHVDLTVGPIQQQAGLRNLMMIVFEEVPAPAPHKSGRSAAKGSPRKGKSAADLASELLHTRESLQTTIEELETSNEELKSTNEELQSTNEELQSTNEELETSREELQSLNEESSVVNTELQVRNDELCKINDDMRNLLDASEIATIFLDMDLKVRRFTTKATELFPLTPADIGRPVAHFASRLADTDLADCALRVLTDLQTLQREVHSSDGRVLVMRVRLYRTESMAIEGVVITFEDVTDRRKVAAALSESEMRYRKLFELAADSIVLMEAATGKFVECNRSSYSGLGYSRDEFMGLGLADIAGVEESEALRALIAGDAAEDPGHASAFAGEFRHKSGEPVPLQGKGSVIVISGKKFIMCAWRVEPATGSASGPAQFPEER